MDLKKRVIVWIVMALAILPFQLAGQSWVLIWSDEFDGDALDMGKWAYQTGTGVEYGIPDWGNAELQYYQEANAMVGDGNLTIRAKKEFTGGKSYTSARIRTLGKRDWNYCRIEFRAKMPIGQGLWAAVWMLPTNNIYGGWASSGEIDIMEYLGQEPSVVHGTLHFGGEWPANQHKGTSFELDSGDFHSDFHDFAMDWEEGVIRWYVDGELYQTLDDGDWWTAQGNFPAPFNKRFHLLINLAVGGNWPGAPDINTQFPQDLVLDYVRVYEDFPVSAEHNSLPVPAGFGLDQNFPNPFSSSTYINFSIPTAEHVFLELFDATGRKVRSVLDAARQPGTYRVSIEGTGLAPGLYSCRFRAGSFHESKHILRVNDQ